MKFVIKHEIRGRIRVHLIGKAMSFAQADTLQYQFEQMKDVTEMLKKAQKACTIANAANTAAVRCDYE